MAHQSSNRIISFVTLLLVFQLAICEGICVDIPASGAQSKSWEIYDEHDSRQHFERCDNHILSAAAATPDTAPTYSARQVPIPAVVAFSNAPPGGVAVHARLPWARLIPSLSLIVLFGHFRN